MNHLNRVIVTLIMVLALCFILPGCNTFIYGYQPPYEYGADLNPPTSVAGAEAHWDHYRPLNWSTGEGNALDPHLR